MGYDDLRSNWERDESDFLFDQWYIYLFFSDAEIYSIATYTALVFTLSSSRNLLRCYQGKGIWHSFIIVYILPSLSVSHCHCSPVTILKLTEGYAGPTYTCFGPFNDPHLLTTMRFSSLKSNRWRHIRFVLV